ncbi:MAG: SRPBCC family protein [Candidatus Limnocylindria bacterium]
MENTFAVDAPIDRVWDLLLDVRAVAPCMPGAEVVEQTGEDSYGVELKVKVGPMALHYRGQLDLLEKDEAEHRATLGAKMREQRGQGTANASVLMTLADVGRGTTVHLTTDLHLTGRVASMGQGVIQDVAASLTDQFAANLQQRIAGSVEPDAPASSRDLNPASLKVGRLVLRSLLRRLVALVTPWRRPRP